LERAVVGRADAVVGISEAMVEDLRARYGVAAELISNGWDPDMADVTSAAPPAPKATFTFLHAGTVTGESGRDPRLLLSAFEHIVKADPSLATRLEVVFVGRATSDDLSLLREPGHAAFVRYAGFVDRADAVAMQRKADALLLLTSSRTSEATGKIFEYLGAGRPIIALAEGNEAARIISDTHTGVCVAPDDVVAIAAALRSAIDGVLEASYAPRGLERYSYPGVAELFGDLVERVISGKPR
jgi:glycosyltransferase involved in cell wall biosynthesis